MTEFRDSLKTEEKGELLLRPWLEEWSCGAPLRKLETKDEQRRGDFVVTNKSGREIFVDLKIVEGSYDKLFIETWSNKQRGTKGWLWTSCADRIVWLFMETMELFVIDLPALKRWAELSIHDFVEVPQKKCDQLNDTWGRLVPRDVLRTEVGFLHEGTRKQPARSAYRNDHLCHCGKPGTRARGFGPISELEWFCAAHDSR